MEPEFMNKTFELEFREDHIYVLLGPDYEVTQQQEDEFWAAIEEAVRSLSLPACSSRDMFRNVNWNLSKL